MRPNGQRLDLVGTIDPELTAWRREEDSTSNSQDPAAQAFLSVSECE